MAAKAGQSGKGRPQGAKTKDYDVNTVEINPCQRCGGTERERYRRTVRHEYAGTRKIMQGDAVVEVEFKAVVFRYTRCKGCGQHRIDKSFE